MSDLRSVAERFADDLQTELAGRLRSVVLHGSVARGEAVEGVSDINLLVLVDEVELSLLETLAPLAHELMESRRSLPLVLTWDEWQAASDVFAIETADMLDAREVLRGDDPCAGATVRPADLRLQAERELRGKVIHLRQGTLLAASEPRDLGRLLLTAIPSVAAYLRAALRLAGRAVPDTTPAALGEGAGLVGEDAEPLLELWRRREKRAVPEPAAADRRVSAVHRILERTADYVNNLDGEAI